MKTNQATGISYTLYWHWLSSTRSLAIVYEYHSHSLNLISQWDRAQHAPYQDGVRESSFKLQDLKLDIGGSFAHLTIIVQLLQYCTCRTDRELPCLTSFIRELRPRSARAGHGHRWARDDVDLGHLSDEERCVCLFLTSILVRSHWIRFCYGWASGKMGALGYTTGKPINTGVTCGRIFSDGHASLIKLKSSSYFSAGQSS